ncbi:hypothetical protein NEMBOFW57_004470 [Staphylotrichum longicolle]|uniref:Tat pathway signal sequence domain protein n=1 Tax=Staphylotrichum longicolle TaxID=669026 RepID=A0AAD4F813_9PEZI|nr:hypothetical protein NEMBOFW57_004470 [Staphylotrichum longicolle]
MARVSRFLALMGVLGAASARVNVSSSSVKVSWIGDSPAQNLGTTFGLPWPQGKYQPNDVDFKLSDGQTPLESWVTGYWRDGSIKWSAHAIPKTDKVADEYTIEATPVLKGRSRGRRRTTKLSVKDGGKEVTVDTGKVTIVFPKDGRSIVRSIKTAGGKTVGKDGKLVLYSQNKIPGTAQDRAKTEVGQSNFESNIEGVTVSKTNSVRALVTVRGKHKRTGGSDHADWLPFVLRFYLYAGSDAIRLVHSITFDGKQDKDFISGLGIQFQVPLKGEQLYNRHVRLAGTDGGFLNEAVKGITGLRRDPGAAVRTAQVAGKALPAESTWDSRVTTRLQWIPVWNDYSLSQLSPDGFTLKKRTEAGRSWVNIPGGTRSGGLAYLGGATQGGLAIALRDFWKRYPTGLDIENAGSDEGQITLWLYSPDAAPLDLRGYHDGLGLDTYEKQLDALEITYEDYEKGFDTPYGIARTNEIFLYAFDSTPSSDTLAQLNGHAQQPPVLVAKPEYIKETKALGSYWALPDTSNAAKAKIESRLDFLVKHYQNEVEARRWYGFLDHGDIMHTYDSDRHQWRYDIGGYAWDNSELSPDLFLWQYFLRTGSADVYRFVEALTRHTGEVDSYHLGDWKGLGTRHGVKHWADSAKQARISQPQYRKYFFYLSGGDERTGELLEHTLDADKTYGILDPVRKVRTDGWKPSPGAPVTFGLGTDWAALAAGWLIEWERRGPRWEEAKKKLTGTATGIARLKNGFVTGSGSYIIENGTLQPPPTDPDNKGIVAISHLNAVFGMPEVISELLEYWGDAAPAGFRDAWLDYTYYYAGTADEQRARYGASFSGVSLKQAHSRLSAFYAAARGNATVAARAWADYYRGDGLKDTQQFTTEHVGGSAVVHPVDEAAWLSTNDFAQYGLASIQNLAYVGDSIA